MAWLSSVEKCPVLWLLCTSITVLSIHSLYKYHLKTLNNKNQKSFPKQKNPTFIEFIQQWSKLISIFPKLYYYLLKLLFILLLFCVGMYTCAWRYACRCVSPYVMAATDVGYSFNFLPPNFLRRALTKPRTDLAGQAPEICLFLHPSAGLIMCVFLQPSLSVDWGSEQCRFSYSPDRHFTS